MKTKFLALMLVLTMLFSVSASASVLSPADFENGHLSGITRHENGLLVTDTFNKVIWSVNLGKVTVYAGRVNVADLSGEPIGRCLDGDLDEAYFKEPWDIAPFLDGYAVTDTAAHVIRFIGKDGVVTAAGQKDRSGKGNGNGTTNGNSGNGNGTGSTGGSGMSGTTGMENSTQIHENVNSVTDGRE